MKTEQRSHTLIKSKNKSSPMPYILLFGALLGSNMVATRFCLQQVKPFTLSLMQNSLASIAFLLLFLNKRYRRLPRSPRVWGHVMVWGLIGTALPGTLLTIAMQYLSSGVASLFTSLNPIVTLVFSYIILKEEKITIRKMAGILIAFTGVFIILIQGENGLGDLVKADWRGYLFASLAVLGLAGGIIYVRLFLKDEDMLSVVSARIFWAAIILFPITLAMEGSVDLQHVNSSGWIFMSYAALSGSFFAAFLDFYITKRFGATYNSLVDYVIPVVTLLLGVLLLKESISITIILGMVLIFSGLAFIE